MKTEHGGSSSGHQSGGEENSSNEETKLEADSSPDPNDRPQSADPETQSSVAVEETSTSEQDGGSSVMMVGPSSPHSPKTVRLHNPGGPLLGPSPLLAAAYPGLER